MEILIHVFILVVSILTSMRVTNFAINLLTRVFITPRMTATKQGVVWKATTEEMGSSLLVKNVVTTGSRFSLATACVLFIVFPEYPYLLLFGPAVANVLIIWGVLIFAAFYRPFFARLTKL